jgi:hypothetical protein
MICAALLVLLSSGGDEGRIFNEINRWRAEMHLPACKINTNLTQAAKEHAAYMRVNKTVSHFESQSSPGFTAVAPWDRAQKAGYKGICFEGGSDDADPIKWLRSQFAGPYHRMPYMQPGSPEIGIGIDGRYISVDIGISQQEGVSFSPVDGQKDVPTTWDGFDAPPPLVAYGQKTPAGYPIVFGYFTRFVSPIKVFSMKLTKDGVEVPCYFNSPATDQNLKNTGFLVSKKPLSSKTTYRVEVKAADPKGIALERTWSFTTN